MLGGLRAMFARDPQEPHRVATPLELFYDLVFVVAVARASSALHHFWAEGHFAVGLTSYMMGFFAIWWAWMNFTWFASGFDTDDWLYRVSTFVQMAGALIIAAGVDRAMLSADFGIVILGYVIMRLTLATQWIRAALSNPDPNLRLTCLRYAGGILLLQAIWILWGIFAKGPWQVVTFLMIVAVDVTMPWIAERAARITWHPAHIAERYGSFTLIVLGECVQSSANSIIGAIDVPGAHTIMLGIAMGALIVVAAVWWIYFDEPQEVDKHPTLTRTLMWGYNHYLIFGSVAALSAGFEVAVDQGLGKSHLSSTVGALTTTIPFAIYLVTAWLVLLMRRHDKVLDIAMPALAVASVAISPLPHPLALLAGLATVAAAVVTWRQVSADQTTAATTP